MSGRHSKFKWKKVWQGNPYTCVSPKFSSVVEIINQSRRAIRVTARGEIVVLEVHVPIPATLKEKLSVEQ